MPRRLRLSDIERSTIAQEPRNGVSAAFLATRYDVSLKTIYKVVNQADERQKANRSRSRVVGIRVSEGDLRPFPSQQLKERIGAHLLRRQQRLISQCSVLSPSAYPLM